MAVKVLLSSNSALGAIVAMIRFLSHKRPTNVTIMPGWILVALVAATYYNKINYNEEKT